MKSEILILQWSILALLFSFYISASVSALDVVFSKADIPAVDRNKVNAILNLHLHVEYLMLYNLMGVGTVRMTDHHGEGLVFWISEAIALIESTLAVS